MQLTVVICTHNRAELLTRTLESLNSAEHPHNWAISLLVVANACSDNTVSLLESYRKAPRAAFTLDLQYAVEPSIGKSFALNRAITLIDRGFIGFVDDDHRVDAGYFLAVSDALERYHKTRIFCGRIIPDWTGEEPDWIHDQGKYRIYPLPVPHFEMGDVPVRVNRDTKLPGGGNLIVDRGVFESVGSFSTSLGPKGDSLMGSEDSDFLLRTLNAGETVQYVPDIIQYHFVDLERLRLRYLIAKSFQRTRSLTIARNPKKSNVPLYLVRKLLNYALKIIFSLKLGKTRFYLMRFASTLGEVVGRRESL